MGIKPDDRRKHMVENMHVLRHLWTKDNEPFEGKFVKFSNITLEPKPVQNPCPIWLATNAERLSSGQADSGGSEFALTRVGKIADGWMTHSVSPEGFRNSWEFILKVGRDSGRDMSRFDHVLYHHINVNDDKDAALADSKKFLDLYYGANYSKERLEAWLTYGSPRDCIEHLKRFKDARLQPRHVPDFDHGRSDGAAPARRGRGAAVCVMARECVSSASLPGV